MFATDVGVVPVEIGLGRREQVQVPLARRAVRVRGARPRRTGEVGRPARGHLVAVRTATGVEPEPRSLGRAGRRRERGLEPGVLVRNMIGDHIDDGPDPERGSLGDQLLRLLERAEGRVDRAVVRDVVAAVGQRRAIPGGEPDGIDPEGRQIGQPRPDPSDVADAIAVAVGEAPDVELVDDGVAPPGALVPNRAGGFMAADLDGRGGGHRRRTNERLARFVRPSSLDRNLVVMRRQGTRLDNTMQELNIYRAEIWQKPAAIQGREAGA